MAAASGKPTRSGYPSGSSEAVAISNLGDVRYRAGRIDAAIEFYERSLLIHRDVGDRCRAAETLWRLGWVMDALGQQAQARACWHVVSIA